jgi:membrane fusion protein (multidrug efflux system)
MSTPTADPTPPPPPPAPRNTQVRLLWLGGPLVLAGLVILLLFVWVRRRNQSLTDDAFVEAHIVNIAPQTVSGHIVCFHVEENDHVEKGQLLAEIDPKPYRDQVNIARSKAETARAELRRQEAGLDRLRQEVPVQIGIACRAVAAAEADEERAREAVTLTKAEVVKGIEEACAAVDAAQADLVLAEQEYTRYTELEKEKAATLRRAQEVTRARDAAAAHLKLASAKLARAEAERTRIEVMKRTLQAAEEMTRKARKGLELAETGYAQLREVELLVAVKKEDVEDAVRALEAAENNLSYTQIRAPFPGVVVKRYRHQGDFASPGVAILSMYNPNFIYVTAYLEEDRLRDVNPGNAVELQVDAFSEPFRGRVLWINKSTGAEFSLMPRNVVSGEFTRVVQRVPVRILIEKDDRWPQLRAGLSVRVVISHGPGDPRWAEQAAREMAEREGRP